jgi:hypothetical protein
LIVAYRAFKARQPNGQNVTDQVNQALACNPQQPIPQLTTSLVSADFGVSMSPVAEEYIE